MCCTACAGPFSRALAASIEEAYPMSWSEELRWLIPVAFVLLAELLRRRHEAQPWDQLARARVTARRRPGR
jgi:hypothetical protein